MLTKTRTKNTPIYVSLALLQFFIFLILVNYFRWDFVLIGVFVELLSLPAIAGVIGLFGFSSYRSFWGEVEQRPVYRTTAGILLFCIAMVGLFTFYVG